MQVFAERLGLETGWNCHISFSERSFGLDEHSTLTTVSEGKMEETADEYLVSHVTSAHDDEDTFDNNDVAIQDDDVICHVTVRDDGAGESGEHEDIFEDLPKNEETEIEKKVKWQDSEGTWPRMFSVSSSSRLIHVLALWETTGLP